MALSGTITGSTNNSQIECKIVWSATQSISGNYSDVTATLYYRRTNSYTTYGTGTFIVGINNTNTSNTAYITIGTSWVKAVSGTVRVAHNSDGSKSIVIAASGSISGTTLTSTTCKATVTLDKIPRYATVSQSNSSKTETAVTMKWTSDSTIDYIWYSTNNGSSWTGINVADGKSGTYTITGLSPDTKYNIKTRVRRKDSQLTTDSSTLAVTTYAYPYASSMPSFTIGNKLTLTLYNPLGRSVTVNILGADNSQISNDTTTGTSISGYNGTTVVNRLYASIPNTQSGTYKVKVTYGSQVATKTGGTYSINKNNCLPSIGSASYQDTNSTVVAITGNNQQIVRNQSTVRYTATSVAAQKSATVSSVKVVVNGTTYTLTNNSGTWTGGNAKIDSGSNVNAVFTVTDSRGLTASKTVSVKMLDWVLPSAIITMERENNFYSKTNITVDASYSSVNSKNTIAISYKAKKQGTSTWTISGTLQDNVASTFTADNNYAWNVQVTLTDKFGTTTYNLILSRGMPIIFFDRLNSSVGVNCFPSHEESLEVNGHNIDRSTMTRALSANVTNLTVNTYTKLALDLTHTFGDKLTATSDGGIKIGAGVSNALVSGRLTIQVPANTAGQTAHIRIIKNSYTNPNTIGWSADTIMLATIGQLDEIIITPMVASVAEGDVIYLLYYSQYATNVIQGGAYGARTSLTVEVLG